MSEEFEQRIKQSQSAKRTNLAEWYAAQAKEEEIDLPSGLRVVVRDIDIEDLVLVGGIPQTLLGMFEEVQNMPNEQALELLMGKDSEGVRLMIDAYIKECMVEPRIGDVTDPEEGILSIKDMRGKDKFFMFNWLNREAVKVKPFSEGEEQPNHPA